MHSKVGKSTAHLGVGRIPNSNLNSSQCSIFSVLFPTFKSKSGKNNREINLLTHPTGRALTSDPIVNSFIRVIFGNFRRPLDRKVWGVLVLPKLQVTSQKLGVQAPQNLEFE